MTVKMSEPIAQIAYEFIPVSINENPRITPANGCDIVIDGKSTNKDRIVDYSAEMSIANDLQLFKSITSFGYCTEELKQRIIAQYTDVALDMIYEHIHKLHVEAKCFELLSAEMVERYLMS